MPTIIATLTIEEAVAAEISQSPTPISDEEIVARLLAEVRRRDRSARGTTGLFRFTRNGSNKSERTCYLCNASTSWCSKWPRTVRSWADELSDTAAHVLRVRTLAAARIDQQAE